MKAVPLIAALLLSGCAAVIAPALPRALPPSCPLPRQTHMLNIELYFGSDIAGRAPVTPTEWDAFVTHEIAPRFPDGFTVLAGYGQWLSPNTGIVGREPNHVVRIWAAPAADLTPKIQAVASAYKAQFHQEAVGVTITEGCARFTE